MTDGANSPWMILDDVNDLPIGEYIIEVTDPHKEEGNTERQMVKVVQISNGVMRFQGGGFSFDYDGWLKPIRYMVIDLSD